MIVYKDEIVDVWNFAINIEESPIELENNKKKIIEKN